MTQAHFTVFGGSFVQENHDLHQGFNPAPRRREQSLAVWGFILGSLLVAVITAAMVTVSVAQSALY